MDTQHFLKHIKKLEAAFDRSCSKETLEVYYDVLENADPDRFAWAVDEIVKNDFRFPSVARIREVYNGDIV